MAKLTGELIDGEEVNASKLFLPGLILTDNCVQCGDEISTDLGVNYVSFPRFGREMYLGMFCQKCRTGWSVPAMLKISLELVPQSEGKAT